MNKIKIILLLFFSSIFSFVKCQPGYAISLKMFAKTKEIKTLSFTMKKLERIKGQMTEQISSNKLVRNPLKVYSKQIFPKNGLEVLYADGSNHNKALINTNGFPWVNLSLSPTGNTMRANQHHTILETGYDHVISILEHLFSKYGEETKNMVRVTGEVIWKGDTCWSIIINNPYFRYVDYTVKNGESIVTIAKKFFLSEYMILEKNKKINDYESVITGQIIKIPNDYSPKIIFFIDKKRLLPIMMQVYDDIGLYELYEYSDIVINPQFHPDEFTKNYKGYGF